MTTDPASPDKAGLDESGAGRVATLKHIVAATDLSASSVDAVERGFLIAKAAGARYTILHAVSFDALVQMKDFLGEDVEATARKIREEATARLRDLVAESSFGNEVPAVIQVEAGRAAFVVPAFAAASEAGLLVVGAHGHGFLHRILLGSTASILIRECRIPVLVVKLPPRQAYRRVLVAVDFSPASISAIATARAVSPGAALTLLHVADAPLEGMLSYAGVGQERIAAYVKEIMQAAFARLRELAEAMGLQASNCVVAQGDATRQIVSYQERLRSDLVVAGKHGTNITQDLLLGSVTNHLVAELQSDLLVVVDERRPDDEP